MDAAPMTHFPFYGREPKKKKGGACINRRFNFSEDACVILTVIGRFKHDVLFGLSLSTGAKERSTL